MDKQTIRLDEARLAAAIAENRPAIENHDLLQQVIDLAADDADRRMTAKERSRLNAWRIAMGAVGVAAVSWVITGAVVALQFRPPPEPKVLVVEKASGLIQPLISLSSFQMDASEATIRRNVNTFVLAREGYSWEQADTHYYTAAAFMSPQMQSQWAQAWDAANPDSPPRKYKQTTRVRIKIGSITILHNALGKPIGARASFSRSEVTNDQSIEATNWIATISFHWVNQPTDEQVRRINDLGWEVTDYVVDRDLGAPKPAAAPAPELRSAQQKATPVAMVSPTVATTQVKP